MLTTKKIGLADFGGEGGARIVGGPRRFSRDADQRGEAEPDEGQPQGRAGEQGGRGEVDRRHDQEGRQRADLDDVDFAPRPAPGGHRQRGRQADGERRARRGEAEQQPEGGERGEADLGGDEGLHGGGLRRGAMFTAVNYGMMLSMSTSNSLLLSPRRSAPGPDRRRPRAARRRRPRRGRPARSGAPRRRLGDRHLPPFQGQGGAAGGAGGRRFP